MRCSTTATARTERPQDHGLAHGYGSPARRVIPLPWSPLARPLDAFTCGEARRAPYETGQRTGADPLPDAVGQEFLQADRVALSLRGAVERTTVPLARAATALVAAQAWGDFGFARLDDYARERLGRSGRWVRDLAALGARLATLPRLAAAITGEDGARPLGRVAAMLVARAAAPESLDAWIARARTSSIRALRDAVREARAAEVEAPAHSAAGDPAHSTPDGDHDDPLPSAPADEHDDPAERLLLRMALPSPVLAAFDEAADLFRAVEGGEAPVAAFIEALLAEAAASGDVHGGDASDRPDAPPPTLRDAAPSSPAISPPHDADLRILSAGPAVAAIERAFAATTGNWRHLPAPVESSWAVSLAGVTLARFRALAAEAGRGVSADFDRQLRALVAIENELESRLGALLADLADRRAWSRLRFAGVGHYGEERLGLSRTTAEDRARLARDLRPHPRLREAYAAGHISREAAALIARLLRAAPVGIAATADTPTTADREAAWVARALDTTVKRMRDEARALGRYRVLAAVRPPARAAGEPRPDFAPLDDAAWHASLRREPGLARRRIRTFGSLALTSPDVFQALPLEPDVHLRLRLRSDLGHRFLATVEAERRRLTTEADALAWDDDSDSGALDSAATPNPAASPARLAARMFSIRCRRLPAWVGLLSLLEDFVDTWDDERGMPRRPGDEIYIRDGWRCAAPGCTSRRNLEVHHLRYRSRGGDDEPANLICLCRFHHHRGEHGGLAACRGRAPTGVDWRLGRLDTPGAPPTWYRNERRVSG